MDLRNKNKIFLVGSINLSIMGSKLPSNKQVLQVLFFNIRVVKLSVSESANLVIREVLIFWEKARLPTKEKHHCAKKLQKLYDDWRYLQKNNKKSGDSYREKEKKFVSNLDNLFDIAHADVMKLVKVEEDRKFLIGQRQQGRIGYLGSVDFNLHIAEEKRQKRKLDEEERRERYMNEQKTQPMEISFSSVSDGSNEVDNDQIEVLPPLKKSKVAKRGQKHFITEKLVSVLDRCQVSVRNAVYILQATAEALGHNVEDLVITQTSIYHQRKRLRSVQAELVKQKFKSALPPFLVVHWDGKMLPSLNVHDNSAERLPIVVTGMGHDQLLAVSKLPNSTGKEQAIAVYNALEEWNVLEKVQAICCDTTASNTGRLSGACVLLEQMLDRELLYLPCRHHIFEIILRGVFEAKLPHLTSSPDIPLFKEFKKCWSKLDKEKYQSGIEDEHCRKSINDVIDDIADFAAQELKKSQVREDYRELLELTLIFLNINNIRIRLRPPGAMHQARWMSRAIYCLKIFMFRGQYPMEEEQKAALADVCIFIVRYYIKIWFNSSDATVAPVDDLHLIKNLKKYESVDFTTSDAALRKLSNHLWYLTEEAAALAFFDERLSVETKAKMVRALKKPDRYDGYKKIILSSQDMGQLLDATMEHFISSKSMKLFSRLQIDASFLNSNPQTWHTQASYIDGKKIIKSLKVVNDTAERAVKLMQDYHGLLTKNESDWGYILQCIQEHRKMYPNCSKKIFKNNK